MPQPHAESSPQLRKRILVTGATGRVGRDVVERLVRLGHEVRALTRRPAEAGLPEGVEVAEGSPADVSSLAAALRGVTAAFVVLAGDVAGQARNFAVAAEGSGLRKVVLLSSASVLHPLAHGIADEHRAAEEEIRAIDAEWTFLRPGPFHANTGWWTKSIRGSGAVRCWIGNNPGAPVDESDIAAVATAVLIEDGHAHCGYVLTGPELISSEEQARILGEVLGRDLDFSVAPQEEVVEIFTGITGDREAAVTNVRALHSPRAPWTRTTRAVEELTGRRPRPFREWAAANTSLFR